MSPFFAMNDGVNSLFADAIFLSESFERNLERDVASADFSNVLLRKFVARLVDSFAMLDGRLSVPIVVGMRKPFEVFYPIVGLVHVFMVHGRSPDWRRFAKKSERHKAMNKSGFRLTSIALAQHNHAISAYVSVLQEGASSTLTFMIAAYAPDVRNLVKPFVTDNWKPNLIHS